jgi:hypothetical protein
MVLFEWICAHKTTYWSTENSYLMHEVLLYYVKVGVPGLEEGYESVLFI